MSPARLRADDVASSEAERSALAALREATGAVDGPMERHCLRVFATAWRLAERQGAAADREVLLCAALLHDIGGYVEGPADPYVSEAGASRRDSSPPTDGSTTACGAAWTRSSCTITSCLRALERVGWRRSSWSVPRIILVR